MWPKGWIFRLLVTNLYWWSWRQVWQPSQDWIHDYLYITYFNRSFALFIGWFLYRGFTVGLQMSHSNPDVTMSSIFHYTCLWAWWVEVANLGVGLCTYWSWLREQSVKATLQMPLFSFPTVTAEDKFVMHLWLFEGLRHIGCLQWRLWWNLDRSNVLVQ